MKVASYGGGVNSTAMIIKENPDLVIFADTGGERPDTYAYVEYFNRWLKDNNKPEIITVKSPNTTLEDSLIKNCSLPSIAYGFKTCSQRFKIEPADKYLNNNDRAKDHWKNGGIITKLLGYDAGEPHRAKDYTTDKYTNSYPLIDNDIDREECKNIIRKAGLKVPDKSSCFFCPNMRQSEIRELNERYPDLARRAVAMEDNADLTVIKGLGRNWAWKDLLNQGELFDFPERYSDMPCGCVD